MTQLDNDTLTINARIEIQSNIHVICILKLDLENI